MVLHLRDKASVENASQLGQKPSVNFVKLRDMNCAPRGCGDVNHCAYIKVQIPATIKYHNLWKCNGRTSKRDMSIPNKNFSSIATRKIPTTVRQSFHTGILGASRPTLTGPGLVGTCSHFRTVIYPRPTFLKRAPPGYPIYNPSLV